MSCVFETNNKLRLRLSLILRLRLRLRLKNEQHENEQTQTQTQRRRRKLRQPNEQLRCHGFWFVAFSKLYIILTLIPKEHEKAWLNKQVRNRMISSTILTGGIVFKGALQV